MCLGWFGFNTDKYSWGTRTDGKTKTIEKGLRRVYSWAGLLAAARARVKRKTVGCGTGLAWPADLFFYFSNSTGNTIWLK